jgi:arylsulfatase A-like enzyme
MKRFSLAAVVFGFLVFGAHAVTSPTRPNIVFILADDLGYGDVKCLNPEGKIATPNLDRIAREGIIFTDAHSSSAVCTPTRYGLMTGRYNWRSRLQSGVQGGMSPRLIEPGRLTVPALLRQHGYHTCAIGKWHLGMDWALKPGARAFGDDIETGPAGWNADFTKPITDGPNSVGFDDFYGLGGSLDMVPYTFIENDHVTAVPTVDKKFPMMFGRTNGYTRNGPAAAEFEAVDVLPTLTRKAVEYVTRRSDLALRGQPFFLYLALASPHTPIIPSQGWQRKSGLNPYADFVMQTDASVGEVLRALDRGQFTTNTLVVFTSDNGCAPQAGFTALMKQGHNPSYHFRGTKADIYEGGHHVPFLARWPGHVAAGSKTSQLICLNDLMATCAELLETTLPPNAGEDSVSFLGALFGDSSRASRKNLVHHSINGSFAIREGDWKLALCAGSGGWSEPRPGSAAERDLSKVQLFNLAEDPREKVNLQDKRPELVARLTGLLEKQVAKGRSTPGNPQTNTTTIRIRKDTGK